MTPLVLSARRLNSTLATGDRILFVFLLSLSLCSYFWVNSVVEPGSFVIIATQTRAPLRMSLEDPSIFRVQGTNGDVEVEIAAGQVRITKANCPHQVCVRQSWIGRVGEVLVCVPNAVSIWIEGKLIHQIDAFTG